MFTKRNISPSQEIHTVELGTFQIQGFPGSWEMCSPYVLLSKSPKLEILARKAKWYIVKAMVFPVIMYRCESWTIKKAECWRIDSLELWCWRRLLRVSWAARRSNQSMLKEINPEHSLEGLMLKLQYFGHFIWRADSLEKTLMLGKIEGRRRRGVIEWDGWMASATQWAWVWANTGRQWRIGKPGVLQSLWFSNWTTTTYRL